MAIFDKNLYDIEFGDGPGKITYEQFRKNLYNQESNNKQFNDDGSVVTSKVGALGKGQVMPKTALKPGFGVPSIFEIAKKQNIAYNGENVEEATRLLGDSKLNELMADAYMDGMIKEFNTPAYVAMAYNLGPGATQNHITKGIRGETADETADYITKLLRKETLNPALNPLLQPPIDSVLQPSVPETQPVTFKPRPFVNGKIDPRDLEALNKIPNRSDAQVNTNLLNGLADLSKVKPFTSKNYYDAQSGNMPENFAKDLERGNNSMGNGSAFNFDTANGRRNVNLELNPDNVDGNSEGDNEVASNAKFEKSFRIDNTETNESFYANVPAGLSKDEQKKWINDNLNPEDLIKIEPGSKTVDAVNETADAESATSAEEMPESFVDYVKSINYDDVESIGNVVQGAIDSKRDSNANPYSSNVLETLPENRSDSAQQNRLTELLSQLSQQKYSAPKKTMADRIQLLGGILSDNFSAPGMSSNRLEQVQARQQAQNSNARAAYDANRSELREDIATQRGLIKETRTENIADRHRTEDYKRGILETNQKEIFELEKLSASGNIETKKMLLAARLKNDEQVVEYYSDVMQKMKEGAPLSEFDKAVARAYGKKVGETKAILPQAVATMSNAYNFANKLKDVNDDQLNTVLGLIQGNETIIGALGRLGGAALSNVNIDQQNKIMALMNQVDGTVFESAYESLRGAGHITVVETTNVANARAALNRAQNATDFKEALSAYQGVLESIIEAKYQMTGAKDTKTLEELSKYAR